jgi:NAD+ diphosphatase
MAHGGKFTTDALEARFPEPEVIPETALWVLVKGDGICVSAGDVPAIFSGKNPEIAGIPVEHIQYLGHWGPIACYAAELRADAAMPAGLEYSGVRELFGRIPEVDLAIAAFAVRMIDFDRTTKFCGRCGAATRQLRTERSKTCTACNLITYPRLSPAIIVLVVRDDQVLLARSPRFPPGMFGLIAGFIEPGENLEDAVRREVKEETGIAIKNIRYFGSEPWPFPNSLMIGFIADFAGGELILDPAEIEEAFWFDREHMPLVPERLSISRALIDWWVQSGEESRSSDRSRLKLTFT